MIGERVALRLRIRGIVQGVGYRPFVYRTARAHRIDGWVRNDAHGVEIHAEGEVSDLTRFCAAISAEAPPAANVTSIDERPERPAGMDSFTIDESDGGGVPTTRVSPDLPVCAECLEELFDPSDRRFGYPYINCTNCGPRYSIIFALPYDRAATTMHEWAMCEACRREYHDPGDRRFHAQPVACPACGPTVALEREGTAAARGSEAIAAAARLLCDGAIVAIKGIGGYHLACDAANNASITALRERKFRKERPFALMARDIEAADALAEISPDERALLEGMERPIVLLRARAIAPAIAPDNRDVGVMLPYTPAHHLLFAAGAPPAMVMTSANRSSEPIAYDDTEARASLAGIADALLTGERRIARRVDDSVVRSGGGRVSVSRRGRGLAPAAVATLPVRTPILALGGDLKNAVVIVVDGNALVSQHVGDLSHYPVQTAFRETIRDVCAMYELRAEDALVVHDAHPEYVSTRVAGEIAASPLAVQHHRAHVASVCAERGAWDTEVVGVAFDGTGWGDDGTIWGGEIFTGTVRSGFVRTAHLRTGWLPGGDAAARFPVQAAAGFLTGLNVPDLTEPPFAFPPRYRAACALVRAHVRTFATSSMGRLFDTVAALCGFTRQITFEGQAAMWLEHIARNAQGVDPYPFPLAGGTFDYAPLLEAVAADRKRGRPVAEIARAFHESVANAVDEIARAHPQRPVVVSGGVMQNALLVELLTARLGERLWLNASVPANDGGLALGQAALAAFSLGAGP